MYKLTKILFIGYLWVAAPFFNIPFAKVTMDDAVKLGNELTPLGGDAAANSDGSIPAYKGGLKTLPVGFKPGKQYVDPYKNDIPLFTITHQNLKRYRNKLSPGQVALFKRYPDTFSMHIYPTRRSTAFPQLVYDAVKKNALNAVIDPTSYDISGWKVAYPFPIPQNGLEAIMNVVTAYSTPSVNTYSCQAISYNDRYSLTKIHEEALYFNAIPGITPNPKKHIYFKQSILSPPREAGRVLVVHIPSNRVTYDQNAWVYNPGQRCVRRAPTIKYDGPGTLSDGLRTTDDYGVFNGAPDKYMWALKGKKELYVPYNCYKLIDKKLKYKDILHNGHINPTVVRYELHRLWVLEATLKHTKRHIYIKRTIYVDEDSWAPLMAESYDSRGELWRVVIGHLYSAYDIPAPGVQVNVYHDLESGRYLVQNLTNEEKGISDYGAKLREKDFSASALRRAGRR